MIFGLTDDIVFPPPQLAREDGLLAIGGDLSEERLILAYSMGIFPWYAEGDPILWWSPDPRLILELNELHISRRLARIIKQEIFEITCDTVFPEVIRSCSKLRPGKEQGTWIMPEMVEAYCRLHELGYAHSVECWLNKELVGGLYGVSLGKVFFGESMFSKVSNSSKVALVYLVKLLRNWEFNVIDCQLKSDHLVSLGAKEISGWEFRQRLKQFVHVDEFLGKWECDVSSGDVLL